MPSDNSFVVKDSGARQQFASGMVRDTQEGKTDFTRALDGPMFQRWNDHLTKGATKYPDVRPGVPNWTLAAGNEELARFKKSAMRHFIQWFRDEVDEDHAAAVFFNINGAEMVKGKMAWGKDLPTPTPERTTIDRILDQLKNEEEFKKGGLVKRDPGPRCDEIPMAKMDQSVAHSDFGPDDFGGSDF